MLDIFLRPLKDKVVDPLVLILKHLKVSPNVFTLISGIRGKNSVLNIFSNYRSLLLLGRLQMALILFLPSDKTTRWH